MTPRLVLNIALLLALFTGSIILRESNINKPLGRHHEWITAHSLITLRIWEKEGLMAHHFSPVYSFPGKANAGIGFMGGVMNKDGRYYYTSYPPFAFLLPYFIFHPLGITPDVRALQILGLAIHFICCAGIFLLIYQLYNKRVAEETFLPAFTGFVLYCYSYGNLWFHMNLWFCDILMQVFFIYGTLIYFKVRRGEAKQVHYILLVIVAFLAVYTEWLGLFMVMLFALTEGIRAWRKRTSYHLFLFLSAAGILALILTLWQYSSINGLSAFLEAAKTKYLIRSGYQNRNESEYGFNISNPASYAKMDGNYNGNYLALINLSGIFGILFLAVCTCRRRYFMNRKEISLLFYILIPVLLYHLVFFNFNIVHDFSTLKTSFLIIVLLAVLSHRILLFFASFSLKIKWIGFLGLILVIGIKCYESGALYRKNYDASLPMPPQKELGLVIRNEVPAGSLIITNAYVCPELIFYSGRNMISADNRKEAMIYMQTRNDKAVFLDVKNGILQGIYPL